MDGPGEYLPDVTEGITRVEDLPKAKVARRSRSYKRRPCPECEYSAYRDRVVTRTLHDLGDLKANRPVDVKVSYSQHHCSRCGIYFNADMSDLDLPPFYVPGVVRVSSSIFNTGSPLSAEGRKPGVKATEEGA